MDMLERSNKKFLKHILGVPESTADPTIYILTGTIPLEGVIHKRTVSLFGNICIDRGATCRTTVNSER